MIYPSVTAGEAGSDYPGFTNESLQAAVDAVAGGGEVVLSEGVYTMKDALRLRSGVTVRGLGDKTVLKKTPSAGSDTIGYMGIGHFEVKVKNPELFEPGSGVYIYDNHAGGFYSTVATVISVDGNRLLISRALCGDINASVGGRVESVYPIIEGYGIADARISDLTIDGNRFENHNMNGCRGAGVMLIQSDRVIMRRLTVKNFNGDALSFQHGVGCVAEDNLLENNAGSGLHPGGGSVAPALRGNRCINNDGDGIFYCLRVTYSDCENNICSGNKRNGISIGHRDNNLLIKNNIFESNGQAGIFYRPDNAGDTGVSVIFENNTVRDNFGREYDAQVYFGSAAKDVCFFNNKIVSRGGRPAFKSAAGAVSVWFDGNEVTGETDIAPSSGVFYKRPDVLPSAGCVLAKPEHALHLGRPGRVPF